MKHAIRDYWQNNRSQFFWDIGAIPIAVLLIVGATLGWVAYDEYQQTQVSEYRLLEAHARNADVQVAVALDEIDHLLNKIAKQITDTQSGNRSPQDKTFAAVLDQHREDIPELGTLLLTDATGRIRAATNAVIVGKDISSEPYFVAHLDRGKTPKLFMSRPDKRLLGVTTVACTLPIFGNDHQFLGIVGVAIEFKFFPRVLQAINSDDSASMSVIYNRDGDIVYRRDEPERFFGFNIAKVSKVFQEHSSAVRQVTRHIGPSAQNGKTRLFLVMDVGNTGLSLILSRQFDEVLAKWRRNIVIYALIFVFTTMVVSFLAIIAARSKREVLAGKAFADQLIATANVMVVGLDTIGQIAIFNETAERISGYSRSEIIGHSWLDLAVPTKASSDVKKMFDLFREGAPLPHTAEYPILTKSGQERIISWQNSVIHEPRAAISFGIDVTEQREHEAELAVTRELLRGVEHRQMLSQERQRLMQDMHDGLGSSLVSALRVVEHGNIDEAEIAQVLKSCIDDLKLAIDSMEPVEADLLLLLATLRFRLEPRLESTGIVLRWEVKSVPDLDWLDPKNALHILRILQEAFTNIIKHTRATKIRVATEVKDDYIAVTITDNGQGFSLEHALKKGGKGLPNQMRRAESIGAKISFDSNDTGMCLTLLLPINRRLSTS